MQIDAMVCLDYTQRDQSLVGLEQISSKLSQVSTHGDLKTTLTQYMDWIRETERMIGSLFGLAEAERLVFTRRHEQILRSGLFESEISARLLYAEIEDRRWYLDDHIQLLKAERMRRLDSVLFVPDTNIFLMHPEQLGSVDFRTAIGTEVRLPPGSPNLRMILVKQVLRELDAAKKSEHRGRASDSLRAILKAVWEDGGLMVTDHGTLQVEILHDPRGRVRQPNPDDEILDRANYIRSMAGRDVCVLSNDANMLAGARDAGFVAIFTPRRESVPKKPREGVVGVRG